MRRPLIQDQATAVVCGAVAFVAGCVLLWDAWEGRGGRTPRFLRPFLPV
jgi:hypothetical protein